MPRKKTKTAMERTAELMDTPMNQWPELAIDFLKKTSKEVGFCGEVAVTSAAVYAQCIENLPCEDKLYKASKEDRAWFKEQMKKGSI